MNIRAILIPALLLASFAGSNAQQRKCDMAVNLIEPAPSAVINAFAQYNIRVNILNNGPDTLFAGDTLYYNKPTQFAFDYDPYILTQPINPGDNATLTLETLNNINSDQTDQVMNYYIYVVSNPENNGRFIDTANDDNNYDVNANVTFKAGQPTTIGDIGKDKVKIDLYPNPVAAALIIRTDAGNAVRSAKVLDISGRMVLKQDFGAGDPRLDVSALLPGIYFIRVETAMGSAIRKCIKN